jgi:hypothetical protein
MRMAYPTPANLDFSHIFGLIEGEFVSIGRKKHCSQFEEDNSKFEVKSERILFDGDDA